jgi:hypothetical protein
MPFTPSASIAANSTPIETRTAGDARRRRRSQCRRTAADGHSRKRRHRRAVT